jgi:hypothetical protein
VIATYCCEESSMFRSFVKAEMEKWGKVVREANIKLG